jgi:hypothetical protein
VNDASRRAFVESILDPAEVAADANLETDAPKCEDCGADMDPDLDQPRGARWERWRCPKSRAHADAWINSKTGQRR